MQKPLYWAILLTESSHIFCCVLPTIFSILSLLVGLGIASTVPGWLEGLHAALHQWEVPMIIASGIVVALGWGLYAYSRKIDCHDSGCDHPPCDTKKDRTHVILKIATLLFIINVTVYGVFHRDMVGIMPASDVGTAHNHDH